MLYQLMALGKPFLDIFFLAFYMPGMVVFFQGWIDHVGRVTSADGDNEAPECVKVGI